jgi:hypothetical protein
VLKFIAFIIFFCTLDINTVLKKMENLRFRSVYFLILIFIFRKAHKVIFRMHGPELNKQIYKEDMHIYYITMKNI